MTHGKTSFSVVMLLLFCISFFSIQPMYTYQGEVLKALSYAADSVQQECAADLTSHKQNSSELYCAVLGIAGFLMTAHSLYEYHLYRSGQKKAPEKRRYSYKNTFWFLMQSVTIGLEHYYQAVREKLAENKDHLKYLLPLSVANLLQFNLLKARHYFRNYSAISSNGMRNLRLSEVEPEMTESHSDCVVCLDEFKSGDHSDFHAYCTKSNKHLLHEHCARNIVVHSIEQHKNPTCPECRKPFEYEFFNAWYEKLLTTILLLPNNCCGGSDVQAGDGNAKGKTWQERLNKLALLLENCLKHEEQSVDPTKIKTLFVHHNNQGTGS